jgi:hypothetical protein
MQIKKQDADARMIEAKAHEAKTQAEIQKMGMESQHMAAGGLATGGPADKQVDTPVDQMLAQADVMDAQTRAQDVQLKAQFHAMEDRNRDLDRQSRERVQLLNLAKEVMLHPTTAPEAERDVAAVQREIGLPKP